jgi:hypothetical protein
MTEPALMDPPAAPPVASTDVLTDLILARLLTTKSSIAPKKLRADLAPLFASPPSAERLDETLKALRAASLITPRGYRATGAGQAHALSYLGVAVLPPRANWGMVKAKFLLPKALGLSPTSADDAKVFSKPDKLAPLLLKRKLGLPVGTPTTLGGVFEAIACRELGYPDHTTLKSLIPHLLGKAIGSDESINGDNAKAVVPRVLLDVRGKGMEGLRAVALKTLTGATTDVPFDDPEPFDLEAFANTVRSVARTSPTGRFGDNKVFISHIWRQLQDETRFAPLGPAGFKAKLVEANRARLLTLSRADLVQFMDPTDVCASEVEHLGSVFHFVLVGE